MTAPPPPVPTVPGLELLALLHQGRHVNVYDAWSTERGCRCIVKTARPGRTLDARSRRDLLAEGRLLNSLTHPHIVRLYDVVKGAAPAVVLETLSGHTLSALLDQNRRLPVHDVLHLGLHLCSAVGYLHRQGWLHLDLKPSNVVADSGRAKLIDLSIARRPGRRRPGIGTPGYLAPEQALGHPLGPPADVWGIGGLLYEALTGDPAVPGTGTSSSTSSSGSSSASSSAGSSGTTTGGPVIVVAPTPLRTRRRVPPGVVGMINATLDLDPGQRPTLAQVAGVLAGGLGVTLVPHADATPA